MKGKHKKNVFSLEMIEPRLLLSADPIFGLVADNMKSDLIDSPEYKDQELVLKEDIIEINAKDIQSSKYQKTIDQKSSDIFLHV